MEMFTENKYTEVTYYHGFNKLTYDRLQVGDKLVWSTSDDDDRSVEEDCTVTEVYQDHVLATIDSSESHERSTTLWIDNDTIEQFRRKN